MKRKWWVLPACVLFALVSVSANPRNSLKPVNSLSVYDSGGKPIGTVVDTEFTIPGNMPESMPVVALRTGQQVVRLGVKPDHFVGSVSTVYFGTNDCSGTPYMSADQPSLFASSYVDFDGTLYVSTLGATGMTVDAGSIKYGGYNQCTVGNYGDNYVVEAQVEGNLKDMYRAPFVLR